MTTEAVFYSQYALKMAGKSLEADGSLTIYEIENGDVLACYEGLEVHGELLWLRTENQRLTDALIAWIEVNNVATKLIVEQAEVLKEQDDKLALIGKILFEIRKIKREDT